MQIQAIHQHIQTTRVSSTCELWMPTRKYNKYHSYQLHKINLGNKTRLPSVLAEQLMNLSYKNCIKKTIELSNRNLIFVPTPTLINKSMLNKQRKEDFYMCIKLKP